MIRKNRYYISFFPPYINALEKNIIHFSLLEFFIYKIYGLKRIGSY